MLLSLLTYSRYVVSLIIFCYAFRIAESHYTYIYINIYILIHAINEKQTRMCTYTYVYAYLDSQ